MLDLLADPHLGYPIVHVAGTNGKGSTAALAAALLDAHGLTSGLVTSPHLHEVQERYRVGGDTLTRAEFVDVMGQVAPIVRFAEERRGEGITYFELTSAIAYAWFAERAVNAAVVETGLGGRLDATRAAPGTVSVVTTVGLEHTEYLGDTLTAIAGEKLAIVPPGGTLVTGRLHPEAAAVAALVAADMEAVWIRLGTEVRVADAEPTDEGWRVSVEGVYDAYPDLALAMRGRHQVDNLAVAVAAVEMLMGRALDPAAAASAASGVSWPGRMEVVRREPLLMVDGAHNPPGMEALVAALGEEFPGVRWQVVVGAMADKDVPSMLAMLAPRAAGFHAVAAAGSDRALPPERIAALAGEAAGRPVPVYEDVRSGLAAAVATGESVLVTGSLYVVGEARRALGLA